MQVKNQFQHTIKLIQYTCAQVVEVCLTVGPDYTKLVGCPCSEISVRRRSGLYGAENVV